MSYYNIVNYSHKMSSIRVHRTHQEEIQPCLRIEIKENAAGHLFSFSRAVPDASVWI